MTVGDNGRSVIMHSSREVNDLWIKFFWKRFEAAEIILCKVLPCAVCARGTRIDAGSIRCHGVPVYSRGSHNLEAVKQRDWIVLEPLDTSRIISSYTAEPARRFVSSRCMLLSMYIMKVSTSACPTVGARRENRRALHLINSVGCW